VDKPATASSIVSLAITACLSAAPVGADFSETEIATSLDQLAGVWSSEGYGQILEIRGAPPNRFDRYEVTGISCLRVASGLLEDYQGAVSRVLRNAEGTRFTHSYPGVLTTYGYRRLGALPENCRDGGTAASPDPLFNFDVLWATFNEQYAFFAERHADWNALRSTVRSRLSDASSEEELFDALTELVTPLCDAHVELVSDFAQFNGLINPACSAGMPLFAEIIEQFNGQTQYADAFEYYQQVFVPEVLGLIDDEYLVGSFSSAANGRLRWGVLGAGIGYLAVLSMTDLAGPEATPAQDLAALAPVLDQVMNRFAGYDALVVDVRLNTGGYDRVAFEIARRLADRPRVAFTKQARWGIGHTPGQAHTLDPGSDEAFDGRVVVLTSELTASAAENFLLATRAIPRVNQLGETTAGVHSDVLERHLPNGWSFTLSNEVYRAADGTVYEGIGMQPHIEVPVLRAADRNAGADTGLEAALDYLASEPIDPGIRGTWWDPTRDGEGYMFDFLVFGGTRVLFVTFYTYDAGGNQAYLVGQSSEFSNPMVIDVYTTEGGEFGPGYDPDRQSLVPWGTLTVDFHNCMESTVTLTPGVPGFDGYTTGLSRFGDSPFELEPCP
jgi:hypothetical protein